MTTSQQYLEAYDRQLRTDAETPSAIAVERLGPLRLATFAGGQGFVTYQDLGGADAVTIAGWVARPWRTTVRTRRSRGWSGRRGAMTARQGCTTRWSPAASCRTNPSRS